MSNPRLECVSITGADDAVDITDLNRTYGEFPFVEWAILLMPESMGTPRFPSADWIRDFTVSYEGPRTAMHLCGGALLGFIADDREVHELMRGFGRIQLNLEFGPVDGKYDPDVLLDKIRAHPEFEFIIQYTPKSHDFVGRLRDVPNHAVLFDASAGRGILPDRWPAPLDGHVCGYAGGLKPENIAQSLDAIAAAAGDRPVWIDMESGVRSGDDADRFELPRVRRVLELCAPFAV